MGKANQNNYVFSVNDTRNIIAWIDEHLSVQCVPMAAADVRRHEAAVIRELEPLLNTSNNPAALPELKPLRKTCRNHSRSPSNDIG